MSIVSKILFYDRERKMNLMSTCYVAGRPELYSSVCFVAGIVYCFLENDKHSFCSLLSS